MRAADAHTRFRRAAAPRTGKNLTVHHEKCARAYVVGRVRVCAMYLMSHYSRIYVRAPFGVVVQLAHDA